VDQVEVGVIEPQALQRGFAGGADAGRRQVVGPDLGGDEDLAALQAGGGEGGADLGLVAVHLGGVDVAVAEAEGGLDRALARRALHRPGAEAEGGHPHAVRVREGKGGVGLTIAHGGSLMSVRVHVVP
jgi:hypothetical protein